MEKWRENNTWSVSVSHSNSVTRISRDFFKIFRPHVTGYRKSSRQYDVRLIFLEWFYMDYSLWNSVIKRHSWEGGVHYTYDLMIPIRNTLHIIFSVNVPVKLRAISVELYFTVFFISNRKIREISCFNSYSWDICNSVEKKINFNLYMHLGKSV